MSCELRWLTIRPFFDCSKCTIRNREQRFGCTHIRLTQPRRQCRLLCRSLVLCAQSETHECHVESHKILRTFKMKIWIKIFITSQIHHIMRWNNFGSLIRIWLPFDGKLFIDPRIPHSTDATYRIFTSFWREKNIFFMIARLREFDCEGQHARPTCLPMSLWMFIFILNKL